MGKYFGTDGIRGEANAGAMTPAMAMRVAQAFGVVLRKRVDRPKVILGKDTRVSGYMLEGAMCAGLCSVGCDVLFVGPLPTPGIAYLTRGMRADAGIVLSASHNPYADNGIKLFDRDGFKLPDAAEAAIEELIDSPQLDTYLASPHDIGRARRIDDAIGQYSVFLKERFPKSLTLDGVRIVVDAANGAAYKVAPKVLSELGAEVFCINDAPNGFNINLDAGALHPEQLQREVLRYRANMGLALDGDADRLVIVDEKGNVVDGDQVIAMCALEMKKSGELTNNTIVTTIMSNKGLEVAMEKAGISVVRTPVGDRYVVEEMRRRGAVLGGEQSGHLLFLDSSTTGDGIIAALKVLEMLVETGRPLSELSGVMKKFPQVTASVRVAAKPPVSELPLLVERLGEIEAKLGTAGRVLFRYSGTEPKARITLEGPDAVEIRGWAQELEELVQREISAWQQRK